MSRSEQREDIFLVAVDAKKRQPEMLKGGGSGWLMNAWKPAVGTPTPVRLGQRSALASLRAGGEHPAENVPPARLLLGCPEACFHGTDTVEMRWRCGEDPRGVLNGSLFAGLCSRFELRACSSGPGLCTAVAPTTVGP